MSEAVSLIVAVVILFLVFRWVLGSNSNGTGNTDGRGRVNLRRRNVTPDMVETVKAMFPEVSTAAIQADLALTGSVETTCDKILQLGGLPIPSHILPRQGNSQQSNDSNQIEVVNLAINRPTTTRNVNSTGLSTSSPALNLRSTENLIQKYKLENSIKNKDEHEENVEKVWQEDGEKRQQTLLARKQAMVLQARKKLLEKQKQK